MINSLTTYYIGLYANEINNFLQTKPYETDINYSQKVPCCELGIKG